MSCPDRASRLAFGLIGCASAASIFAAVLYARRRSRSRWVRNEDTDSIKAETSHSIIALFEGLVLDPDTTVGEANKRRTSSYYLKMRQSHELSFVPGVARHLLFNRRQEEVNRIYKYWNKRDQSHRTIVAMCDAMTRNVLDSARKMILGPLAHSSDIETNGCWIPAANMIPAEDMHVTIALPWWWHTVREGNAALTKEVAQRLRQTLLLKFHYPFQIELERIILLGGKVLVALWRCVGARQCRSTASGDEDAGISNEWIEDRHGESTDPMVRLREEIIRCFVTESPDQRRKPLTYQHMKGDEFFERQHTIKKKTPGTAPLLGMASSSADGFIHTTLCRLPLDCLSSQDVELDMIHRLCREASATLNGHRMLIDQYRFLETMGEGGESNPCFRPIYDETIRAPVRHNVGLTGAITEDKGVVQVAEGQRTIGPARNFMNEKETEDVHTLESGSSGSALVDLFRPPNDADH